MEQRIFKFRAWDTSNDKMCHWHGQIESWTFSTLNWASFVFMQFTGLCDKNNKEIYEGDVIQFPASKHYKASYWLCEQIGEDMDGKGWGYHFSPNGNGKRYLFNQKEIAKGTVTGNIYEHPHLLNSEQGV